MIWLPRCEGGLESGGGLQCGVEEEIDLVSSELSLPGGVQGEAITRLTYGLKSQASRWAGKLRPHILP